MDEYTQGTRAWLDKRFKRTDDSGIYYAHQPIYGFRRGHSEERVISRYIVTYQIMKALSKIEFDSLLDVGGAEGYKSFVCKKIFGAQVRNCDLSEEACKRAREIFGIESDAIDIHSLPYTEGQFDVVTCSETLEHVRDYRKALSELLRVANKAVIVTVPHETSRAVEDNLEGDEPHSHINRFSLDSFDYLNNECCSVYPRMIISPAMRILRVLVEAMPLHYPLMDHEHRRYPEFLVKGYNNILPFLRKLFGEKSVSIIIKLDELACWPMSSYYGILATICKEGVGMSATSRHRVSASQVVDIRVPYHYMQ